ncbi:hypothetical protein [Acerihabitans arboris]|uniref:Uncharacterized protein n=1 Tax=Acerihabitans arboris TaxID=2691583 RepID=A0A845SL98_9GAMM|nr:hypothetical protein [Acerihabitans arboris]NDL63766.1 hypothetical protein [Acerihabitans arboris]
MTLDEIWGLKFLGKPYQDECILWAEEKVIAGCGEQNILILASLGMDASPDGTEVEYFFGQALSEQGESQPDRDAGLKNYSLCLCHQIVNQQRDPESTAKLLADINRHESYNTSIYSLWNLVVEDLTLLYCGHSAYENSELTLENKDRFIDKLARHFIVLQNNNVPSDFLLLSVCKSCHKLVRTQYRALPGENPLHELLIKVGLKQPRHATVCMSCGSLLLTHLYSNEQRENALGMLGK